MEKTVLIPSMRSNDQRPPRERLRIYPLHHGIFVSRIGSGGGLQMILSGVENNHPPVSLVQKERGRFKYHRQSYYYQPYHLDHQNLRTNQHNNTAVSNQQSHSVNNPIKSQILPPHHNLQSLQPWFVHLNHLELEVATKMLKNLDVRRQNTSASSWSVHLRDLNIKSKVSLQ